MPDLSELDSRYFVSKDTYNCPYCNRRHVSFELAGVVAFDWSDSKHAMIVFIQCDSCGKTSMHLTYELSLITTNYPKRFNVPKYDENKLDSYFFYHQPTSFFTLDSRIPAKLRELITEAENCRNSNLLVGASACLRKAIYELLQHEGIAKTESDGKGGTRERHYDDRVKDLKDKRQHMDPTFVDILAAALTTTSNQLHEDSWDGWSGAEFDSIHDAVLAVLQEMYVIPEERKERASAVSDLINRLRGRSKPAVAGEPASPVPAEKE